MTAGILQELINTMYAVELRSLWAQKPESEIAIEEHKLVISAQKENGADTNVAI